MSIVMYSLSFPYGIHIRLSDPVSEALKDQIRNAINFCLYVVRYVLHIRYRYVQV